jgi:RHS repeat-associated protein
LKSSAVELSPPLRFFLSLPFPIIVSWRSYLVLAFAISFQFVASAKAQFASTPQVGISDFATYQHSDVDSVNLSNGNVFVHIPLVSFPQIGDKLHLNFIIRSNAPQWSISVNNVTVPWNTGNPRYSGGWFLNNNQNTNQGANVNIAPRPIGVDVVRDQGMTLDTQSPSFMCVADPGTGPASCDQGIAQYQDPGGTGAPYYTQAQMINVRDRTGAEHTVGESDANSSLFVSAPDGSGWTGVPNGGDPTVYRDREGITYTYKPIINASGTFVGWASDLSDSNNNKIITSVNGWTDSAAHPIVPGSYSGPGSGFAVAPQYQTPFEADPFPGIQVTDLSATKCPATASQARVWTIPWANGTTATYYLCYTLQTASTNFGTQILNGFPADIAEGTSSGLLLTQVILPNGTSYEFSYDGYFNLTNIRLPTGGSVAYTWSEISWDENSLSQPATRAVESRTVTASSGDSQTWHYSWLGSSPGTTGGTGGLIPGDVDVAVRVSKPDGNDETHFTASAASGGTETQAYYQGRLPSFTWSTASSPTGYLKMVVIQHQVISAPFFEPLPQLPPRSIGNAPAGGVYHAPWSFQQRYVGQPLSKTVTLDDGSVSQTVFTPVASLSVNDHNFGYNRSWHSEDRTQTAVCQCVQFGQAASVAEYDYGYLSPGPLLKTISTTFRWNDGSDRAASYLAANLLDLNSSIVVASPGNVWAAETDYSYDESPSPQGAFGNLTSVTRVNNQGISPKTQTQYNALGMPTLLQDAMGTKTNITYQCPASSPSLSQNSGLFPLQVTVAYQTKIAETTQFSYDCTLGKINSVIDPNLQMTSYSYNDALARITKVSYPDGGEKTVSYIDTPLEVSITQTTKTSLSTPPVVNTVLFDGLGRTTQTKLTSDPVSVIFQDTTYDPVGRVQSVSNQYRSKSEITYGVTSYIYDALGRKTFQCDADNIPVSSICTPQASYLSWSYNGAQITSMDESGKATRRTSDGLGRLTQVIENAYLSRGGVTCGLVCTSSQLTTTYGYTALDVLGNVTQHGKIGDTARLRIFTYDSLSRLLTSDNPETGFTCYGQGDGTSLGCQAGANSYDANGNLLYKTDANGVTTSYTYDALNRLQYRRETDGSPVAAFGYDGNTEGGSSLSSAGITTSNAIGRLSLISNQWNTGRAFAYDTMGRVKLQTESIARVPGWSTFIAADYDLAGNLTSLIYPDGRQVIQAWDAAGRLGKLSSGGVDFISGGSGNNIAYTAAGTESSFVLGNGVSQSNGYNSRLQPCHTMVSTPVMASNTTGGNLLDRQSFYNPSASFPCGNESGNNGNIYNIVDNRNVGWTQNFAYDGLNRLHLAYRSDGAYNHTYNTDSFGNMVVQDNLAPASAVIFSIDPLTNRMLRSHDGGNSNGDYAYYSSGSLKQTSDGILPPVTYAYNAQNQLLSINGGLTSSYLYNPMDERVQKQTASGTTDYVYFSGEPIAEVDQNGNWTDYLYANGRRIAKTSPATKVIHISGTFNQPNSAAWFSQSLSGSNITIATGDRLVMSELNGSGVTGGFNMQFSTDQVAYTSVDNYGYSLEDGYQGGWHTRNFDLSQYQGQQVRNWGIDASYQTPVGNWDIYFADVSIIRADGSVIQLYDQSDGVGLTSMPANDLNYSSITNLKIETTASVPDSSGVQAGTIHYYIDDHLGTTQMELSAGGWPVWQGQFTPFGGELSDGGTPMHYKFTGKERDTESGLDYFGARYYGSSMGRWMSPDWADKPEAVPYSSLDNPQSLNLYGYVNNNPLSHADPDGHECPTCDSIVNFAAGAFNAWGSDNLAGAGRVDQTTSAGAAGARLGDAVAAVQGVAETVQGVGAAIAGGAEAFVTAPLAGTGVGIVVPGAGAVVAVAGAAEAVHGVATAGTAVTALMKSGGNFSSGTKQGAKDAAGGKCQNCGVETTPGQKSQKGVTPPGSEGQTDHIQPKSKGGTNDPSNAQHLCRDCNIKKSDKVPNQ